MIGRRALATVLAVLLAASAHAAPVRTPPRAVAKALPGANDTLAWVGPDAITVRDLRQRVELMPWVGNAGGTDPDSSRAQAVEALVAEKLLAREADRLHLGGTGSLPRMRGALERALLRDALYRREIAGHASASPAQIDSLVRTWPARGSLVRRRQAAADTLKELGEEALAREFASRVLGGKQAKVEEAPFFALADTLRDVIAAADSAHRVPGGWRLTTDDLDDAVARLGPALDRTLVRFGADSLSVGDIVESLRFRRFTVRSLARRAFPRELNDGLREVVQGEILASEARRRGLGADPELQRELRMWTDAWKAQLARAHATANVTASDDDAFRALARADAEHAIASCAVDVDEVLCGSEREAREVLALLRAGAPFDSLARARTRRPAWEASGGRSGWFPVSEHRVLGYRALLTPLDSLGGPAPLAEGFSVYRARGKKLLATGEEAAATMAQLRESASRGARAAAADAHVAGLLRATPARIDGVRVRATKLSRLNVVTKRFLGFGGEMDAAPTLVPAKLRDLENALP